MADLAELVLAVNTKQFERANEVLRDFQSEAGKTDSAVDKLGKSNITLAGAFKMASGALALFSLGSLIKDSTMLAARFETMGIVMRIAGNNAGYTMAKMESLSKSLQDSGISMLESRNVLTQLATANMDLARAAELGRAAQDLAVVGNTNSSEALQRMTQAIKSNSVEILQTLGLQVSFEAGYKKLAAQLGTTTDKLNEQQKMVARTNETLSAAAGFSGIYEESMTSAGKAITSLTRYWENLKIKMGDTFLPVLTQAVFALTDALKAANSEVDKLGSDGTINSVGGALKEAFIVTAQAVVILGANVAYVFKSIILEITTVYRQAEALLNLDWGKIGQIRKEAQAEAAAGRLWTDTFSAKIAGTTSAAPTQPKVQMSEAERIAAGEKAKLAKATEEQTTASKAFIESLKKETLALTQNKIEQHQAAVAKAVAKAPTQELAAAIQKAGDDWVAAEKKKAAASGASANAAKQALKHAQEYVESLKYEQTQVGLSADQTKMLAAAKEAAKAPTAALRLAIMTEALALVQATQAHDQNKVALEVASKVKEQARLASEKFAEAQLNEIDAADKVYAASVKQYAQAYGLVDALRALEIQELELAAATLERKAAQEDPANDQIVSQYMTAADKYRAAARLKQDAWLKEDTNKIKAAFENQNKALANTAKGTGASIEQSIADSFFRSAEKGKGYFQSLKEAVKGMFNNLTLTPLINMGKSFMQGGLTQAFGSLTGSGGGTQPGSMMGTLGNIGSIAQTALGGGSIMGSAGAYGLATGTSGMQASMLAAQTAEFGVAGLSSTAAAAGSGAIASGLSAIAAAAPYIAAVVALYSMFAKDRGGPKAGGSFTTTAERLFTPMDADATLAKSGAGISTSASQMAKMFGGNSAGVQFGIGYDTDPQGTAQNRIASFVRDASGKSILDNVNSRAVGRDESVLQSELVNETKRVLLAALQASDLETGFAKLFGRLDPATAAPEAIDNLFELAKNIHLLGENAKLLPGIMGAMANLSVEAKEKLLDLAGGIEALAAAQDTYYSNFFSAEEQVSQAKVNLGGSFKEVGLSLDALMTNTKGPRVAFRDLIEGLKDGSGQISDANLVTYAALIKLAGPLDQYLDALGQLPAATQAAATATSGAVAKYLTPPNTLVTLDENGWMYTLATNIEEMGPHAQRSSEAIATLSDEFANLPLTAEAMTNAINEAQGELDDLRQGMLAVHPEIETTGQRMTRLAGELHSLEAAFASIVGDGAQSNIQKLQSLIADRNTFLAAHEATGNEISNQQLQGLQNRGDTAGAVEFLKDWEKNLWGGLEVSLDKAGDIAKIREVFLRRIGLESANAQTIADKANKDAYDSAVKLAEKEQEARGVKIKALQEEIKHAEQLRDIGESMTRTAADLKFGDMSSLNPAEQLAVAATEFDRLLVKARGGDVTALQGLGAAGSNYIKEQRSFSASGGDTPTVFNRVVGVLDELGASLAAVDVPQAQLDTLLAVKDPIIELAKTTVDFTPQAIAGLTSIKTALSNGIDYLNTEIAGATTNVENEIKGLRTDLEAEFLAAQTRAVKLGQDLVKFQTQLEAINANTASTATYTRNSANAPAPTA